MVPCGWLGPALALVFYPVAMTVLEVGPDTVRVLSGGTGRPVPDALVAAALTWIDDPVGLLGESPVAVADLWHAVMATVIGPDCESVVVVHPQDWPAPRISRVLAAANAFADRVAARGQAEGQAECQAEGQAERTPDVAQGPPDASQNDPPDGHPVKRPRRRWPLPVAVAATVLIGAIAWTRPGPMPAVAESAVLVEGRVQVRVPPHWAVERIVGGPGSRRVQVSSPAQADVALHITQSYAPESTPAEAAEVLRRAIAGQPAGVFVDFRATDVVAGRPAVTYRELRPGRVIRWTVLAAGAARISIGCQSPPAAQGAVQAACEEAVRSARELGTDSGR
jgi:type VII secretion-associated protein (TIGR03931 family)